MAAWTGAVVEHEGRSCAACLTDALIVDIGVSESDEWQRCWVATTATEGWAQALTWHLFDRLRFSLRDSALFQVPVLHEFFGGRYWD